VQTETKPPRPSQLSVIDRVVVAMNAIGSLWVLLLVLIICADSFGRSLLDAPIAGVVEFVAVSLAVIVFCQLADTIRLGKLTRSDTYLARMKGSSSILGVLTLVGFEVLGAIVMAIIVVGTFPLAVRSYERGYYIGVQGVFTLPDWPLKALIVLGAALALLCFLVRARTLLREARRV
jgi:TRAP-type mannitol/chloroaromatic compound transport system permease small subunit